MLFLCAAIVLGLFAGCGRNGDTDTADNLMQLVKFTREGAKDIVMINWQCHPRNTNPHPFDFYAYEVRITRYPMGTAETIQENLTKMLENIFTASGNAVADKGEGYNTPEFVPATDGVTYMNPTPGVLTAVKAVENDFYAIDLMDSGKTKTLLWTARSWPSRSSIYPPLS